MERLNTHLSAIVATVTSAWAVWENILPEIKKGSEVLRKANSTFQLLRGWLTRSNDKGESKMTANELQTYVQIAQALEPLAEKLLPEVADKVIVPVINELESLISAGIGKLFSNIRAKAVAPPEVETP